MRALDGRCAQGQRTGYWIVYTPTAALREAQQSADVTDR
jgi:hypothetical protein